MVFASPVPRQFRTLGVEVPAHSVALRVGRPAATHRNGGDGSLELEVHPESVKGPLL